MSGRASQTVLEVVNADTVAASVRTSQAVLETMHDDAVFQVRASQTVLEVLCSLEQFSGYVTVVC